MRSIIALMVSLFVATSLFAAEDKKLIFPVGDLVVTEASDGTISVTSTNSRYTFEGSIKDNWRNRILITLADFKISSNTIPAKHLALNIEEYNGIAYGAGEKIVWIWADPLCKSCKTLIKESQKAKYSDYQFHVYLIPVLGGDSPILTQKAACEPNREEVLKRLLKRTLHELPEPSCDPMRYNLTLVVADVLKLNGVPTVVAPNGVIHRGVPANLESWLADNS
jgi:thiol:disulfide interchange protein DsbC